MFRSSVSGCSSSWDEFEVVWIFRERASSIGASRGRGCRAGEGDVTCLKVMEEARICQLGYFLNFTDQGS